MDCEFNMFVIANESIIGSRRNNCQLGLIPLPVRSLLADELESKVFHIAIFCVTVNSLPFE